MKITDLGMVKNLANQRIIDSFLDGDDVLKDAPYMSRVFKIISDNYGHPN